MANLEDTTHDLLDDLEDLDLEIVKKVISRINSLPNDFWLGLSKSEVINALIAQLTKDVIAQLFPALASIATSTQANLTEKDRATVKRSVDQLVKEGKGAPLTAASQRKTLIKLQADIGGPITEAARQIQRLLADIPPTSKEAAETLLDRIKSDVVGKLTATSTWQPPTWASVAEAGNDAVIFAGLRLKDPKLTQDQLDEIAQSRTFAWVAALINTCKDCLPRHGQRDTYRGWSRRGLPRSGWSVCSIRCHCILYPQEEVEKYGSVIAPLRRLAVKSKEDGTATGLTVRVPPTLLKQDPLALDKKEVKKELLDRAFEEDLRVRRAFRELGRSNR